MVADAEPLPEDVQELQSLVRAQRAQMQHMKLLIEKLKRMHFGRSSERLSREIEQLELQLEEMQAAIAPVQAVLKAAMEESGRPARKPLPEHLPRENVIHQSPCSCPDCGGEMRQIGEDVSEMIEYVPGRFKVLRHIRPKFACKGCERIVQAAASSRPIARGLPGPGLLAHVLVSKYADHCVPRTHRERWRCGAM